MIFVAGAALLLASVSLVVIRLAPDQSDGANKLLVGSALVLAVVLGWQLYLGSLVPSDLEEAFAVVADVRELVSSPDEPDRNAEQAFLTQALSDPEVADVAAGVLDDWESGGVLVWMVDVKFSPEGSIVYHLTNRPSGGWARRGWSLRHALYQRGEERAIVMAQPSSRGSTVFYALYLDDPNG